MKEPWKNVAAGQSRTACAIGVDVEFAGPVGGRLHHAALVPPAANHQQLDPEQLGVPLPADLYEKGVEIHVENAGAHAIFSAPTDGAPADDE